MNDLEVKNQVVIIVTEIVICDTSIFLHWVMDLFIQHMISGAKLRLCLGLNNVLARGHQVAPLDHESPADLFNKSAKCKLHVIFILSK